VFLLEAIYYFSVNLFEVRSGYFSDRIERKPTLAIASIALTAAYIAFFTSSSLAFLVFGQVFLGLGFVLNSGTDNSFLFETFENNDSQELYPTITLSTIRS